MLQIFQAPKRFPGAAGAQIASSNRVLTGMGWGVQSGGGQASQVSPPPPRGSRSRCHRDNVPSLDLPRRRHPDVGGRCQAFGGLLGALPSPGGPPPHQKIVQVKRGEAGNPPANAVTPPPPPPAACDCPTQQWH